MIMKIINNEATFLSETQPHGGTTDEIRDRDCRMVWDQSMAANFKGSLFQQLLNYFSRDPPSGQPLHPQSPTKLQISPT